MPLVFAGIFAGDTCFGWILFGGQPGSGIEAIVIALLMGTVYFWLPERYADNIALW